LNFRSTSAQISSEEKFQKLLAQKNRFIGSKEPPSLHVSSFFPMKIKNVEKYVCLTFLKPCFQVLTHPVICVSAK